MVRTSLNTQAMNAETVPSDEELERMIDREAFLLHTAKTPEERCAAWIQLTKLHAMRSPVRIEQMEREAGLR